MALCLCRFPRPGPARLLQGLLWAHGALTPSGCCSRGVGCSRRREASVSARNGRGLGPPALPTPFPPSMVLDPGELQLQGEFGQRWGEVTSSGAEGAQESAQSPHVLPFPHPACAHPLHGGTACNRQVVWLCVGEAKS